MKKIIAASLILALPGIASAMTVREAMIIKNTCTEAAKFGIIGFRARAANQPRPQLNEQMSADVASGIYNWSITYGFVQAKSEEDAAEMGAATCNDYIQSAYQFRQFNNTLKESDIH